jgi:hypothetical protein
MLGQFNSIFRRFDTTSCYFSQGIDARKGTSPVATMAFKGRVRRRCRGLVFCQNHGSVLRSPIAALSGGATYFSDRVSLLA